MVSNVRNPALLSSPTAPGAWAFGTLYAVESVSRASISSVIPIQAYDLLRDEQAVSILYFVVGLVGMAAVLCAPLVFRHFSRRTVYVAGALIIIGACACLATDTLPGQATGMFFRVLAASTLAISLNLYIMEFIPKHGVVRSESIRLALGTAAWTAGPSLGVWLYVQFGYVAPYLWSAGWALVLIALFWWLRIERKKPMADAASRPVNPIANIRRFVAQPRMRLAWLVAFGRSCYWTTFYVYAPILMVATGQGKLSGGLIVSMGNALLAFAIPWGRLGGRIGVRAVVVFSFLGTGASAIAAGLAGEAYPWTSALLLLAGVNFAVALDVVGGAPFFRAAHAYERPEMTAVYRTNLDLSELLPPMIYSLILGFFGLGAVFICLGLFCCYCALVSWRHLPRSM